MYKKVRSSKKLEITVSVITVLFLLVGIFGSSFTGGHEGAYAQALEARQTPTPKMRMSPTPTPTGSPTPMESPTPLGTPIPADPMPSPTPSPSPTMEP